jgi:hypothetical protein
VVDNRSGPDNSRCRPRASICDRALRPIAGDFTLDVRTRIRGDRPPVRWPIPRKCPPPRSRDGPYRRRP